MTDQIQGKISVITPCFNEVQSIRENVIEMSRFFREFAEDYEIICVDDGSRDGTLQELQSVADPHIKVLYYSQNQGKGFALRHGFEASNGDYVVFLDADLDLHPFLLHKFFDLLREKNADVVVGSKRHPESLVSYPRRRRIISEIYYYMLLGLFGLPIRDTQVGLKLFKREALESVFEKIICKRFALDVELLANIHRRGCRIVEAPIKLDFKREVRWGRIGFSTLRNTLVDTLAVFYRMYILKYYDLTFLNPRSYPKIAVVVQYNTYSAEVEKTLRASLQLEYDKFQIIALGKHAPGFASLRIKYISFEEDQHSFVEAIKASDVEAIAFIRAGSIPGPAWLENAARNLGSPNIVGVSGPVLSSGDGDFWSDAGRRVLSSITGCGGFRYRYVKSLHQYIHSVTMENLIIKKADLLVALESNSFNAGVETWLGRYLDQKPDHRIVYDPEVAVCSRVTPLFRPYLSGVYEWGLIRGSYLRQNPSSLLNWREAAFLLPSMLVLFALSAIPLAFISPCSATAIAIGLLVYLGLVLLESFSSLRLNMAAAVFAGIMSTHAVYGIGCLTGMLHLRCSRPQAVTLQAKTHMAGRR